MLLAIDPGETNGWALFNGEGNIIEFGQGNIQQLHKYLSNIDEVHGSEPSTVIIESYRVLPTARSLKANVGTKVRTVESIGIVRSFAMTWNCTIVEQEPGIKKIASMWTGLQPPSNHKYSHQVDAMLHGYYYLIKNGIRKVTILPE